MRRIRRVIGALVLGFVVAIPAASTAQSTAGPQQGLAQTNNYPQVPQPAQGGVNWGGVGYGAGTVGANLLYVPAKVLYMLLGGITGGAGYLLTGGNSQTSDTIWRSALGGDYVLTPDMIKGNQPIYFSGPTETPPSVSASTGSNIGAAPPLASADAAGSSTLMGNAASAGSMVSGSAATSAPAVSTLRPMDRGAGPVNPRTGASGSPGPAEPLPDTRIE